MFKLIKLPFKTDSLEPTMDEETVITHHQIHHQSYVDKLNKALIGNLDLSKKSIDELLKDLDTLPDDIRDSVRNFGGGYYNHNIFWESLTSDLNKRQISDDFKNVINNNFESLDNLLSLLKDGGLKVFGSGWVWLVKNKDNKLKIIKTSNQDSPISEGLKPLLTIDVWEHAYYLKYKADRALYLDSVLKIINWQEVEKKYFE